MTKKIIDQWDGCYPSKWKGLIVEDAFGHPAKFSNKLIRKIYDHIVAEGWVQPGDTIVDPFGGVALGALDAMRHGLSWRGCELEERFVRFGCANIELWNKKFSTMPKWSGDAVLLQGDSRYLAQVLRGVHGAVSSPPYADSINSENGIDLEKLGTHGPNTQAGQVTRYGTQDAQLGAKKATDQGFQMAVTSPPFAEKGQQPKAGIQKMRDDYENNQSEFISPTDGNLMDAKSTAEGFQASITRPPFLQSEGGHPEPKDGGPIDHALYARHNAGNKDGAYGEAAGQLSADSYDDFWISARVIVEQVYQVLEPGAHAVWVVKDYVKNKERVPFCAQWQQMCEAVGFVTLHEHHAMLVRHKGVSTTDMDGKVVSHEVSSKTFFRRLAEKKGSPKIDFETVLCMVKPV